ncbi:bifunctional phosphopantothenoylcysteine decarboxylase/phosphopantothenate synthase [Croceicoccus sp. F390]|uniref:Coenzyme A biosynthesis bifunctional protein CoaBC n=1 Tax=Croceicoccus esteveae TaxID=3075597 RepID=A0ABU2ZHC6_9SPHN|nr:bifunctional phosphopantothenoylcysteine decarboxylase/phosphopantothenate synthase [Croceicoccus sp. F390]MDT0575761.1 bifunctional phosphopantothenoylcysteine decarboxylase/phosphopantothenate synthase [Croceicoccus sp. F390]
MSEQDVDQKGTSQNAAGLNILLIVGGGIAAYKACELIRIIRKEGGKVTCVLTQGGAHFVTAMTLAALSEQPVHTSLWDLQNEVEMGHIQLSRQADLVVVCPATADLLASMAAGLAGDLATTLLLATDKPVLAVPAMNVRMWQHPATCRNVAQLRADGVAVMEPAEGAMACGEYGAGRLPDPHSIWAAIRDLARTGSDGAPGAADHWLDGRLDHWPDHRPDHRLAGRHVLVTAGPTHEPIDPVRYIANRSSGKQGYAIAAAAAAAGARVTLISGPVTLPTPVAVKRVDVETAAEMTAAVQSALPADVAILVAAVADWRVAERQDRKIKKDKSAAVAPLQLVENADILANLAKSDRRPRLLIGFAAETEDVDRNAAAKRLRKDVDWIVANDVSGDVMGGDDNAITLVTASGAEHWHAMPKHAVAAALIDRIADDLA